MAVRNRTQAMCRSYSPDRRNRHMRDEINANYNAANVEPMRDVAVKGRNRVHFFRGIRMDAESSMNGEG